MMAIYWALLGAFAQIGLLSFGGGYAALALIQHEIVEVHGWLTVSEFADLTVLSEMTPGPIAINAASFVGMKTAGPLGALFATLGYVLPCCLVVALLFCMVRSKRFTAVKDGALRGISPVVTAMIAAAGLRLLGTAFSGASAIAPHSVWYLTPVFAASFWLLRRRDCSPMRLMGLAGLLAAGLYGAARFLPI